MKAYFTVRPTESETTQQHTQKIQERKSSAASASQLKVFKVPSLSFDAGICGNRLLGHCFLPLLLIEAAYCDCLRKVLPDLLQDVDLQPRIHFCFMFYDAPPHFDLSFRQFLNSFWNSG